MAQLFSYRPQCLRNLKEARETVMKVLTDPGPLAPYMRLIVSVPDYGISPPRMELSFKTKASGGDHPAAPSITAKHTALDSQRGVCSRGTVCGTQVWSLPAVGTPSEMDTWARPTGPSDPSEYVVVKPNAWLLPPAPPAAPPTRAGPPAYGGLNGTSNRGDSGAINVTMPTPKLWFQVYQRDFAPVLQANGITGKGGVLLSVPENAGVDPVNVRGPLFPRTTMVLFYRSAD